ncbi:putative transcription initiation factor TFIIIB subunit Brf1/transcription initiation factor TFIIB [Tetraselmis virus 1]|uniref:Putative transcription initiation factor TFIIIB subunit Brf1/transcription initiation factor TFIIB n=1 Tax=Tetraselmis virus 1 TaxID=2060617 RepID=A0A2P0VML3_9VIRU|nr:putative transcription initiation factor TFIIIB subunit Brf1/transcription initiation factor TFIIB [Tetraselmis virus 1]AUF82128.1 putative transcription initiation factor TFIIIB subunit Brf1/transcription initiation factor TFIIB [Tetraselmis virus 1]
MLSACVECECTDLIQCPIEGTVCKGCGLVQASPDFDYSITRADAKHKYESGGPSSIAPVGDKRSFLFKSSSRCRSVQNKWISELKKYGHIVHLQDHIIETAVVIYQTAIDRPDWKNRKRDNQNGILIACLFHACNIHRAHRTPAELCAFLNTDPRCVRRMVKVVQLAADKIQQIHNSSVRKISLPQEVIPRCTQRMNISDSQHKTLVKEINKLYDHVKDFIDNHRPDTICAGLISVAVLNTKIDINEEQIAEACLVSVNTVKLMTNKINFVM